ncbi:protein FAM117A [Chanos chanos]|uniref:Protein FAM117A n=1 Tax=Chanos chanos TaxID=29144 RepID=A0A6J2VDH4_CHACN|nr:protein FAM117A-like [Chanos chanos]
MSSRGGAVMTRGNTSGLQPLKATVPFRLHKKAQVGPRYSTPGLKTKLQHEPQVSTRIRRTLSLDAIVGPYLQGQWPRDGEKGERGRCSPKDKSTQTPNSWSDGAEKRLVGGIHKRSSSWSSAEQLREIAMLKQQLQQRPKCVHGSNQEEMPLPVSFSYTQSQPVAIPLSCESRMPARLRHSEERLDQELERAFIRNSPLQLNRLLEVPDGHRAPAPPLSCSSGSQSDTFFPPHLFSSPSPPPCPPLSQGPSPALDVDSDMANSCGLVHHPSPLSSVGQTDHSPLLLSSSPRPNKSYCFQREPPEGCERVRVCEESLSPCLDRYLSSPDPNKVNFTTHGGSAFCPVSLLKPLIPSVDFLFRSLSVSPGPCLSSICQAPSPAPMMPGPLDSATTAM